MLILTRKLGQEIIINDNIRVSVQRIRGNKISLGIEAPPEVSIQRKEIVFEYDAQADAKMQPLTSHNVA